MLKSKVATDTLSLAEFTQLCGVLGVAEEKDAPARFAEIDMVNNICPHPLTSIIAYYLMRLLRLTLNSGTLESTSDLAGPQQ